MIVKLSNGREIPVEMHKVRIIQKTYLVPAEKRLKVLEEGGYNTFSLRTRDIFLDMLTDSGTNAMSDNQLAAMMVSDDAYAGCESFYKLTASIKDVLGFEYVLPVHQGRAAEHLLAKVLVKPGDVVPMNYHFTTTKAHFELAGGTVLEIFRDLALQTQSTEPFKGNLDLQKFKDVIAKYGTDKIPFVRMEATTNLLGGQPFSMENLREVKKIAAQHNIPLVYDGSLISENAYFIKKREPGYANMAVKQIVQEMFSYADGATMSAKKDALVNMGGFLALNDTQLAARARNLLIMTEGFPTYGGLAGRDLEAIAIGLDEILDEHYLQYRIRSVEYLGERLTKAGVAILQPPGGHAIYLDAKRILPHVPAEQYPGQALVVELYRVGGIRSVEIGSVMFGKYDPDGKLIPSRMELVRLAIPRRVYTQSHIDYVIEVVIETFNKRQSLKGYKIVEEAPMLRHFTAKFAPLD